jgi:hypothetical protein
MKINHKILALMVGLAAGSAVGAGTTAGTVINNQASATYTDPATGAALASPLLSNTVATTVLPVPALDIVYKGQAGAANDGTAPGGADANFTKTGVLPGANVDTTYTVLNNGNVNGYVVTLNNGTTATPINGVANNPSGATVQYFLASDTTFSTPITTVTVPASGQVDIVQRIKVPAAATVGTVISVSPYGTAAAGNVGGNAYPAVDEAANLNVPVTPAANKDLQFTDLTVFSPALTNTPPVLTATDKVITPPIANAANPLNPVSPPGTPGDPTDPSTPGYIDPANPSTPIGVAGNAQIAYPPADANGTPDVTTFNNVVTTPAGAPADTISLFPTDATGNPIGTNNGDGSFTLPGGQIVRFLKPDGTPLPTAINPADGKLYPVVTTPAGGGTAPYRTQITYPDPNPNTNTAGDLDNPVPFVLLVGADSTNDADIKANATTTDSIYPAAAQFGDVPSAGSTPNKPRVGPGDIAQAVVPGAAAAPAGTAPAPGTVTDSTAVFPMLLANTGEYGDTYTLSGTVPVKLTDGTTVNVPVRYVDAAGNALPSGAAAGTYISPYVGPNSTGTVYAVIDIPANAAATKVGGTETPLLVAQTATGNFSTIVMTDNNDQITIGSVGGITVDKYQAVGAGAVPLTAAGKLPISAKPGDTVKYAIVAKNTYNQDVLNFKLIDSNGSGATNAFTYTTFVSASVTLAGFAAAPVPKVFYSVDGGATFTATVPTAATVVAGTGIQVAIDTDGSNTITATDKVPSGASIELDITTTVK